jgi:hypothetical protein
VRSLIVFVRRVSWVVASWFSVTQTVSLRRALNGLHHRKLTVCVTNQGTPVSWIYFEERHDQAYTGSLFGYHQRRRGK